MGSTWSNPLVAVPYRARYEKMVACLGSPRDPPIDLYDVPIEMSTSDQWVMLWEPFLGYNDKWSDALFKTIEARALLLQAEHPARRGSVDESFHASFQLSLDFLDRYDGKDRLQRHIHHVSQTLAATWLCLRTQPNRPRVEFVLGKDVIRVLVSLS